MMVKEITGRLDGSGIRIGIVVGRFNDLVTDRLLQGALDTFRRLGVVEEQLTVVRVPGSFELPFAVQQLAQAGNYEGIVCLGALIRGETDHYEYLASHVTGALTRLALDHGVPIAYGLITANTVDQALNRSGLKQGNKGAEAALSVVEMATLASQMPLDD